MDENYIFKMCENNLKYFSSKIAVCRMFVILKKHRRINIYINVSNQYNNTKLAEFKEKLFVLK